MYLNVFRRRSYIRQVKQRVTQPVTYADVWEFWMRNPSLADEVDFITIHILPYWEDVPIGMDRREPDGKLTIDDLTGGTFTITNGGVFGSLVSTPIINYPQVGILGLHKIQDRPIALKGAVVIRPMMYIALSYDHRLIDGQQAVQFLVRLKELMEDPESMLIS